MKVSFRLTRRLKKEKWPSSSSRSRTRTSFCNARPILPRWAGCTECSAYSTWSSSVRVTKPEKKTKRTRSITVNSNEKTRKGKRPPVERESRDVLWHYGEKRQQWSRKKRFLNSTVNRVLNGSRGHQPSLRIHTVPWARHAAVSTVLIVRFVVF